MGDHEGWLSLSIAYYINRKKHGFHKLVQIWATDCYSNTEPDDGDGEDLCNFGFYFNLDITDRPRLRNLIDWTSYIYVEEIINAIPHHLVVKRRTKRVAGFNKLAILIICSTFVNIYNNDKRNLRNSSGPQIIILETPLEEFQKSSDENILT